MLSYPQIIKKAYTLATAHPLLWPAGFLQFFALPLAVRGARLFSDETWPQAVWSLLLLTLFSLASVVLWLQIQAYHEKRVLYVSFKNFLLASAKVFGLAVLGVGFFLALRLLNLHWAVFALLLSLFNATLAAAMLSAVVFSLSLNKSLWLALDLWGKKISFISNAVFVIIISNGVSFYLAHAFWPRVVLAEQFSIFDPSATILILLVILAVVAAFFATFLNAFLVLLFLEIMQAKKDPEGVKAIATQPITETSAI